MFIFAREIRVLHSQLSLDVSAKQPYGFRGVTVPAASASVVLELGPKHMFDLFGGCTPEIQNFCQLYQTMGVGNLSSETPKLLHFLRSMNMSWIDCSPSKAIRIESTGHNFAATWNSLLSHMFNAINSKE